MSGETDCGAERCQQARGAITERLRAGARHRRASCRRTTSPVKSSALRRRRAAWHAAARQRSRCLLSDAICRVLVHRELLRHKLACFGDNFVGSLIPRDGNSSSPRVRLHKQCRLDAGELLKEIRLPIHRQHCESRRRPVFGDLAARRLRKSSISNSHLSASWHADAWVDVPSVSISA
jgi:hypothetical protein